MIALALLPLAVVAALAAAWWCNAAENDEAGDVRLAWIAGGVGALGIAVVMAEALSAARALQAGAVIAAWSLLALGAVGLCASGRAPVAAFLRATGAALARQPFASALIGGVFAIMALCGWMSPPNNYDSMTYHVARVHYWLQQQSLDFFATPNPRQVEFAPLNSLVFAHLHLLTGGDRFDNLVQWIAALVLLLPAASWLMERFGAARRMRGLGLVGIASTPAVIVQGESAQNDLLLAALLVATATLALRLAEERSRGIAVALGIAAGLSILTKGTALIFGAGLALWWLATARPWRSWRIVRLGVLAGLIALAVNFPHSSRNLAHSGRPFGQFADISRMPETSVRFTVSNLLKNVSLQCAIARASVNAAVERAFAVVHEELTDFSIRDVDTHFEREPYRINRSWRREEYVGHWVGLAAVVATAAMLPLRAWRRHRRRGLMAEDWIDRPRHAWWWGGGLLVGWLAYSALLRWQPWGGRLLTPLFCFAWIWVAACWRGLESRRALVSAGMIALVAAAAPWLVKNETRPLLGPQSILRTPREKQWFNGIGGEAQAAWDELTAQLASLEVAELGWYSESDDDAEYPVLAALRDHPRRPRVHHVGVANATAILERRPPPEFVLGPPRPELIIHSQCYTPVWANAVYGIYRRKTGADGK